MTSRRRTAAALLRIVAAGTCWGLAAVMAKFAFDRGVPPVRMVEARVAVALAVLVVILVLFGARKIPEFAKGLGKGLTEFKKASREVTDEIERAVDEPPPPPPPKAPPSNSNAENTAQPSAVPKT